LRPERVQRGGDLGGRGMKEGNGYVVIILVSFLSGRNSGDTSKKGCVGGEGDLRKLNAAKRRGQEGKRPIATGLPGK